MKKCSICGKFLDSKWKCSKCDSNKCDVCGRVHKLVVPGRWLFYCSDNPLCKEREINKVYDNEIAPALIDGEMPDCEALELFI